MAKKIISFLGSGCYEEVKYEFLSEEGQRQILETRFVQEAIHKLVGGNSTIYIGLTEGEKGSRENNWERSYERIKNSDSGQMEKNLKIGLKESLDKKDINYSEIHLENGENQEEIWKNFDSIFQVLDEGDQLYIDITHSFRSIPVIVMSIINYAKFIKNISIEGIYYGAYEARKSENLVPIFDLSIFNSITDWTIGAEKFISSGSSADLVPLINRNIREYRKKIRASDEESDSLNAVKIALDEFSNGLYTVRGKDISNSGIKLKKSLKNIDSVSINNLKPLGEILHKISEKVDPYSGNTLKDLHYTVKLYKELNLVQQAYTLLRENIVNFVALASDIEIDDIKEREAIENIINSRNSIKKILVYPENKLMEAKVEDFVNKDLGNLFNNIAYIRNDLNHSGYREDPLPTKTFYEKLKDFIYDFEEIIDIDNLKLRKLEDMDKGVKEENKDKISKKMVLIFSHKLTDKQREDAKNNLAVEEFIYLPEDLQNIWTNISPDLDDLGPALEDIKSWISKTSSGEDYILIQGDFGASYEMVSFCKNLNLKAIYSTTIRQAHETLRDDGKVQISHLFEHVKFRIY